MQLKSDCLSDCSSEELLGLERTHSGKTFHLAVRPSRTGQPSLDDCSGKWYEVKHTRPQYQTC